MSNEVMNKLAEMRCERVISSLAKNNIKGYYAKDKAEALKIFEGLVEKGESVAFGGSMTLDECGIKKFLREGDYNLIDREKPGLTQDDIQALYRTAFSADLFITSTNAITEQGEIYNIDGTGNRVAAMIFGPKRVVIIAGINKVVSDMEAAVDRLEKIACPANGVRLDLDTPCAIVGECRHCKSPKKMCHSYVTIKSQRDPERMSVILVNDMLGY